MLEIGSLVDGKYKILNKVGQGGMSVVYMAINEKANKTWAVKEVRKDGVLNFESVKQGLVAETNILKKLSHPNLPSIIDVIDTEDSFIIIMDYNRMLVQGPVKDFTDRFKGFTFDLDRDDVVFGKDEAANVEHINNHYEFYTYDDENTVKELLDRKGLAYKNFDRLHMTLEDAFIGLTGKY